MFTILETLRTITPLGIRFWDAAREVQVRDGLIVTARPESSRHPPLIPAFQTGAGVYAFQKLPGLRDFENGVIRLDESPPFARSYLVTVMDQLHRFMPALFRVELPLPYGGLYRPSGETSPPSEEVATRFYLFSAPTRETPPGLATVRAQLAVSGTEEPAAFALVELQSGGQRWFGLTDSNGSAALFFPYPEFLQAMMASPIQLAGTQQWSMTVRVQYEPNVLDFSHDSRLPTLSSIGSQRPGQIFSATLGPPANELTIQLTYDEPSTLRTDTLPYLLVQPAS
jgi:hypothetical protein